MVGQLSTAKSPQQMFGAVTKTYFAKKIGVDPENIVCVSVMPCVAKKAEVDIPNINDAGAGEDVDYVHHHPGDWPDDLRRSGWM